LRVFNDIKKRVVNINIDYPTIWQVLVKGVYCGIKFRVEQQYARLYFSAQFLCSNPPAAVLCDGIHPSGGALNTPILLAPRP